MSSDPNQQREQISQDKMLERVRALLAKAASTQHEAEYMAFTAKAHELMEKYAIEMAQINAMKQPGFRDKPIHLEIRLFHWHTMRQWYDRQADLLWVLCKHNRCFGWSQHHLSLFHVNGFETDVRFVEMLFTSLWEQMESRFRTDVVIEPTYKSKAKSGKVKFVAANRDMLNAATRGPNYRIEYMRGFIERIDARLDESHTTGMELVLRDIRKDVQEFVDTDLQARGVILKQYNSLATRHDEEARNSGRAAANRANLRPGPNLGQTPELPA